MNLAVQAVSEANIEKSYPFEFDVDAFKMNFADIIVALEEAKKVKQNNWFKTVIAFFNQKTVKYAHTAAALAITVLSTIYYANGH